MTRDEIISACTELAACMDGKDDDKEKAKGIAFSLLVEALLCLREIADNTKPVKVEVRNTVDPSGVGQATAEALRRAARTA